MKIANRSVPLQRFLALQIIFHAEMAGSGIQKFIWGNNEREKVFSVLWINGEQWSHEQELCEVL